MSAHGRPEAPMPECAAVPRSHALSIAQQGLWFIARLDAAAAAAYDMVFAFETTGDVDVELLERALAAMQDRHEILRACVVLQDDAPRLAVSAPGAASRVRVEDAAAALEELAHAESLTPIDMAHAPMLRVRRSQPAPGRPDRRGLVFSIPHLVFDGPSADRFFAELSAQCTALSTGRPAPAQPLQTHEAFVAAEAAWLASDDGKTITDAVMARLEGVAERLALPRIAPAAGDALVHAATLLEFPIEREALDRIAAYARARRATPAAVWLAAFELVIWRASGACDFAVSLPVSQRDRVACDDALGYFTNLGLARARIDPRLSAGEFVARVTDDLLDALEARAVPFPLVGARWRREGRGPASMLSRLGFNHERIDASPLALGAASAVRVEVSPCWAKDELKLDVLETAEGGRGWLIADRGGYDDAAMAALAGTLFEILEAILQDADRTLETLPPFGPPRA